MSRLNDVQQPDLIADRYQCTRLLGRGGFAEVYLAEDLRLDKRLVAVKILAPHVGRDEGKLRKFRQEAAIIGHLTNSNTVRCYDFGQDRYGRYYLVMEYLAGKTLHRILKDEKTLDVKRALRIAIQVLDALEEAHQMGIIHRDLKPKNIILVPHRKGERVKVLDFGVARILTPEPEPDDDEWTMVGTATYMSPEQAQGTAVSPASDLYSLGVILYHALTGRPPFISNHDPVALMLHHTSSPVESMLELPLSQDVPYELNKAVLRALEKAPQNRYGQAAHFREVLEEILRREEDEILPLESVHLLQGEEEWPTSVALMSQDINSEELPGDSLARAVARVRAEVEATEHSEDLPSTAHPSEPSFEETPEPPPQEAKETRNVDAFAPRDSVEKDVEDAVVQWLSIAPETLNKMEEEYAEGEDGHTLDSRPRHEKPEEKTKQTFTLEYTNYKEEENVQTQPKRGELAKTDKQDSQHFLKKTKASDHSAENAPDSSRNHHSQQEMEAAGEQSYPVFAEESEEEPAKQAPSENTRERILLENLLATDPAVEEAYTVIDNHDWEDEESEELHTRNLQRHKPALKKAEAAQRAQDYNRPSPFSPPTEELSEEQVSAVFAELASTQENEDSWLDAQRHLREQRLLMSDTAKDSLSIVPTREEGITTLKDDDGWKQADYLHLQEAAITSPETARVPIEPLKMDNTSVEEHPLEESTAVEPVFDDSTDVSGEEHDLDETAPRLEPQSLEHTASRSVLKSWESPSPATLRMDVSTYAFSQKAGEAAVTDELRTVPTSRPAAASPKPPARKIPRKAARPTGPIPPPRKPHPTATNHRAASKTPPDTDKQTTLQKELRRFQRLFWQWKWAFLGGAVCLTLLLVWVLVWMLKGS